MYEIYSFSEKKTGGQGTTGPDLGSGTKMGRTEADERPTRGWAEAELGAACWRVGAERPLRLGQRARLRAETTRAGRIGREQTRVNARSAGRRAGSRGPGGGAERIDAMQAARMRGSRTRRRVRLRAAALGSCVRPGAKQRRPLHGRPAAGRFGGVETQAPRKHGVDGWSEQVDGSKVDYLHGHEPRKDHKEKASMCCVGCTRDKD